MRNNRPSHPPLPTRTPPDLVDSFKKRLEADVPGLSTIFTDATMYEQIIRECPDYFRAGLLSPDAEKKLSELYGKDLRGKQKPRKHTCPVTGFSHLVGKDLDPRERAVADRLAKLAVSNWMPGGDGILSEEPDSDEAELEAETSSSSGDETSILSPISAVNEALPSGSGDVEERLEPDDIVRLLSEEFGPLADEGEEKLLLEADGAVFRDVIILGVIHLTTHRLTFHASLASAQPNSASRVIRAGPVTVHPRGLRRKRRVWLELSSDMLSTYASARDEDRIRPQRSILRALYLYRRNRIAILRSHRRPSADSDSVSIDSLDEDDDTVRIHIPLYRIKRTERVDCMSFASFLNVVVCTACPHPTSPGAGPLSTASGLMIAAVFGLVKLGAMIF
ncbi:hypothetical protein EWM64_g2070 [Hericium alpestre]|uniref:Uncharacterized protein n=1 Tax=Hericium alpestre TaxID=135208 RepID=A0A4Z0A4J2_9AGAM|nr:hypothetical protein EWM64_g2070 [Hericium alpestre]